MNVKRRPLLPENLLRAASGLWLLITLILLSTSQPAAFGQGTAFTYQGRLADGNSAANGNYDFIFALWNAKTGGAQQAAAFAANAVPITDGSFLVTLDFGTAFTGSPLWLEIEVRTNGSGPFTTLSPRQALTPVPYALFAPNAGSATSVAPNSVTVAGIQNAAITALKIAPGQVVKSFNGLADNVALAAGPNVSLTTNANTLTISAAGGTASGGWSTSGNAGTSPTANFLGTTDGQPLVLKAGGIGVNTNNPQAAFHVNGTVLATGFAGDGSGLTNLSASVSAPFTLNLLAITNNLGAATGVAVSGHYAYLTSHPDGGFLVYDISNPAYPVQVAQDMDLPSSPTAVAISGNYAFVSAGSLCTVDISSPTNPVIVYEGGNNYYTWGIAVSGQLACLAADTDGLFLYNISDPTKPVLLAQIKEQSQGTANDVAISGNFVYLANEQDGLRIYNVANPAMPVNISHITDGIANDDGGANGIAVSGGFAYLANDQDGLRIYNVSNPTNPIPVGYVPEASTGSGGSANGVAISGRYAFVANFSDGLRVYDVSDPAHPVAVGAAPSAGGSFTWAVAVAGNYAYTADYLGGLATYFAAPLAQVPGVVGATGFLGDGSTLTNLRSAQLTGQLPAAIADNLWQVGGNAGTTPGQNFLGTTDNEPLQFRVNNRPALTLQTNGSLAIGSGTTTGANSFAVGDHASASGMGSLALGANVAATNMGAYAAGSGSIAGGIDSTALGDHTLATGGDSTAMGGNTLASGTGSTAMGESTQATGDDSLAGGNNNVASGISSVALGGDNVASGDWSTALGASVVASGDYSAAIGAQTTAAGKYSFAGGNGAQAMHPGSFVWADSTGGAFPSTANNQFLIRAQGGVSIWGDVQAIGNLQVNGNLQAAAGMPSVNWDQQDSSGSNAVSGDNVVLASCTNAQPAPGFFVIQASAQVEMNDADFGLTLTGSSNPDTQFTILTAVNSFHNVFYDFTLTPLPTFRAVSKTTVGLTWVMPTSTTGAPMIFHILGNCDSGTSTVFNRNLTVMYFPKPWDGNGGSGGSPGGGSPGGGISPQH